MTTIWQNDDGTLEDGCGCLYRRVGDRVVVVQKSKSCIKHMYLTVPERDI